MEGGERERERMSTTGRRERDEREGG